VFGFYIFITKMFNDKGVFIFKIIFVLGFQNMSFFSSKCYCRAAFFRLSVRSLWKYRPFIIKAPGHSFFKHLTERSTKAVNLSPATFNNYEQIKFLYISIFFLSLLKIFIQSNL
jgi:hypothetical protein